MLEQLEEHRRRVRVSFDEFLAEADGGNTPLWIQMAWTADTAVDAHVESLQESRFWDPERARREILRLTYGTAAAIGPYADSGVARAAERLIERCSRTPLPDDALRLAADLLQTEAVQSTLAAVHRSNPQSIGVLANLLAMAPELARAAIRSPQVLDKLWTGTDPLQRPTRLAAITESDDWQRLDGNGQRERLHSRKTTFEVRNFVDLLGGAVDVRTATSRYSDLAEACLEVTRQMAMQSENEGARVGVLAFGKLGSRELGLAGDLDLVFVYDGDPLDLAEPARYVTRWIEQLRGGRISLFDVDTRLRPDGSMGPVVTTLSGLRAYYQSRAEPWERLALRRARVVATDPGLAERLEEVVVEEIRALDIDALIRRLRELRGRRLSERRMSAREFKWSDGGLFDLELVVQLLSLQQDVRGALDTWTWIERLEARGQGLSDWHLASPHLDVLRRLEQGCRMLAGRAVSVLPSDPRRRMALSRRFGARESEDPLEEVARVQAQTRVWLRECGLIERS